MIKFKRKTLVILTLCLLILCLSACYRKSDPELNLEYSPLRSGEYSSFQNQYCNYYEEKFQNLSIDVILLSMGLHSFVEQYDNVYTGKEDYFYRSEFDNPNYSTKDLVNLYNKNPDDLYYLKPYIDCYLLMDKNKKPSEKELENIKETILYALDYYLKGKDFIGTLE